MSLLDKVEGDLQLYIGGLFTLRRKVALHDAGITHVLSVLRLPLNPALFEGFTHKVVEVDDVDDENLLQYLPECIRFIQAGLESGGGVLVHCAMGKSRSATCVCAYLMHRYKFNPSEALARLRQSRPLCDPNDGFMKQLELFHEMLEPEDLDSEPRYQRWLYQREIELSRACGQAPEADKIRFEDEHADDNTDSAEFGLKCKKCRRSVASSKYFIGHRPAQRSNDLRSACSHYFLDPLSWMRGELEQGKLEGRFECPKCKTNIGKYAWQGLQCNCGEWIVPGISLAKGRVDEDRSKTPGSAAVGIRTPPAVAGRKPGQQNL